MARIILSLAVCLAVVDSRRFKSDDPPGSAGYMTDVIAVGILRAMNSEFDVEGVVGPPLRPATPFFPFFDTVHSSSCVTFLSRQRIGLNYFARDGQILPQLSARRRSRWPARCPPEKPSVDSTGNSGEQWQPTSPPNDNDNVLDIVACAHALYRAVFGFVLVPSSVIVDALGPLRFPPLWRWIDPYAGAGYLPMQVIAHHHRRQPKAPANGQLPRHHQPPTVAIAVSTAIIITC